MKILFVVTEINPLIKSGGLADVAGALPEELVKAGIEVRIAIPDYKMINRKDLKYAHTPSVHKISTPKSKIDCLVSQVSHPDISSPIYLFKTGQGLSSTKLYPGANDPDQDRFLIFSLGVIEWLKTSDWQPDVVHCHDWMTGAIPSLLKQYKLNYGSLITVHNAAYQGLIPAVYFDELAIKVSSVSPQVNLLRMGINTATKINTVSQTYAQEVTTTSYGYGLEKSFARRSDDFSGILNGLDYQRYSPDQNSLIEYPYSSETAHREKPKNKRVIQQQLGLELSADQPLYGMVTRLDDQKGLALIETAIKSTPFLEHGQLVILGQGDAYWERRLRLFADQYQSLAVKIAFDETLAHRIYAASDFFLVPSKYEPCGLTQLIAMSFGAIPIVRKTGGLADTIIDHRHSHQEGTGIVFDRYDSKDFTHALGASVGLYKNKSQLNQVMLRGMNQRFTWAESAQAYINLYQQIQVKSGE